MQPKPYSAILAEYADRFRDIPPSILTDVGARDLMIHALERGRPITSLDLPAPPGGPSLI